MAVTKDDIVLIPKITQTADNIANAGKTNLGREAIKYEKRVNGTLYIYEEIRTGKKELVPVTMYKTKVATNDMLPSPGTSSNTSETLRNLSDIKLPPPENNIKEGVIPQNPDVEQRVPPPPREIEHPQIRPNDYINSITREEAGKLMAEGNASVIPHIKEGVDKLGRPAMQDAIRNQEMIEIAKAKKGPEREAVRQNIQDIEPGINEALQNPAEGLKDVKPGSSGDSSTTSDLGGYRLGARFALELPEIVEIAQKVNNGKHPRVRKFIRAMQGQALGLFSAREGGGGTITLRADLFKEPGLAERVLAHEVGHLVDYLPEKTMSRGNILGRIASLKRYMNTMLEEFPDSPDKIISPRERNQIRNEVTKEILRNKGKTLREFFNDTGLRDSMRREINSGVKDKIAAIVKERGLYTRGEIMNELKGLTQMWKPFDDTADPKFTKYRYSPKELYADAVSVLFNDPALLKDKAPKFHKTFKNWLQRKPEVKQIYEAIQARNNDRNDVIANRDTASRKMSRRGEELRQQKEDERNKPVTLTGLGKAIKKALIDENIELIEKAKKAGRKDVVYSLEERNYIPSEIEAYRDRIDNEIIKPLEADGVTIEDIGEYLKFRRMSTERADIANPLGHTKETATEQLGALRGRLGEETYARIEEAMRKFWNIRKDDVISVLKEADMYYPQLMKKIEDNENYATSQSLLYEVCILLNRSFKLTQSQVAIPSV